MLVVTCLEVYNGFFSILLSGGSSSMDLPSSQVLDRGLSPDPEQAEDWWHRMGTGGNFGRLGRPGIGDVAQRCYPPWRRSRGLSYPPPNPSRTKVQNSFWIGRQRRPTRRILHGGAVLGGPAVRGRDDVDGGLRVPPAVAMVWRLPGGAALYLPRR